MKIRIISIACLTTAAVLLAACTAVYKNSDACEQLMRSKLAESSQDTLKVSHKGVGIDGSRVIVEGSIEHVQAASEVAAASAASAVQAASAAKAARSASGAGASSSASSAAEASGTAPGAASNAAAASSPVTASLKSAKPKTTSTAAAAECTFHGSSLAVFSWLAPANLASPPNPASEATE
ncbi:hypothetical protein [Paraburkholderia fungorum]|uniref:Lipoprotein n=1 Tax=Paraburkholderia fungorum TaxID=134537 RepID=A0A420GQ46_9BURK|nr:hypothetical protein [Paraburkholderia fungorum]RKF47053.1 hypothetical protein BCY88_24145 [Paraburkholderia fungorum]